ncbi:MAG: cbb3-type cytochrome c oxidase subunit I [Acidimicrobiales bacterium]|nr:cbb3-type cytochrome c oxidase subunit I [Acidimicrobiales bacterium]HJM29185.1 cbb3-type cytochrome c oxidase subunit I [Acidimicrobiales bacterium]
MTENQTETESNTDESASRPLEIGGLAGAFGTTDHKKIGRLYIFFGLTGGLLSLILHFLLRLERISIGDTTVLDFGSSNQYFQTWSLSRTSLLFFCVVPLILGLATYLIPLQIGAPSIAFPRASAAAFWAWLIGISIHVVTVFADGGLGIPEPVTQFAQGMDPEATELSILSIAMVVIAILLASITLIATIITQRPQGMTLFELPLFSWSTLVATGIWILTLPVWLGNLMIAWVDFKGDDSLRYGNVENMWDQLSWLWSQPMIFAFAIPVLGIAGEIIPVSANQSQRQYTLQQVGIGALGALSFGAFAQPFFNAEVGNQAVYVVMGLVVVLPVLAFLGGLVDTLVKGTPKVSAHLILALISMLCLLVAAAISALSVSGPALGVIQEIDSDWLGGIINWLKDLQGTVIATSVMEHALIASIIASVAGLYYWSPKIFGNKLNNNVGVLSGLAMFGGLLLSGGSNLINGFLDESESVYMANAYDGIWNQNAVEFVNIIGLIGSILLIGGISLVIFDLITSVILGKGDVDSAENPWNGHTLEWATQSPPPSGNFEEPPIVHSERPLLLSGGTE